MNNDVRSMITRCLSSDIDLFMNGCIDEDWIKSRINGRVREADFCDIPFVAILEGLTEPHRAIIEIL